MKVRVTLNGTGENPFLKMGLTANPFPAIADAHYHAANRILSDLAAKPIASVEDLQTRLAGCDQAFIDLCVSKYVPGQQTSFLVTWPDK